VDELLWKLSALDEVVDDGDDVGGNPLETEDDEPGVLCPRRVECDDIGKRAPNWRSLGLVHSIGLETLDPGRRSGGGPLRSGVLRGSRCGKVASSEEDF
jgi:hypothetical protein